MSSKNIYIKKKFISINDIIEINNKNINVIKNSDNIDYYQNNKNGIIKYNLLGSYINNSECYNLNILKSDNIYTNAFYMCNIDFMDLRISKKSNLSGVNTNTYSDNLEILNNYDLKNEDYLKFSNALEPYDIKYLQNKLNNIKSLAYIIIDIINYLENKENELNYKSYFIHFLNFYLYIIPLITINEHFNLFCINANDNKLKQLKYVKSEIIINIEFSISVFQSEIDETMIKDLKNAGDYYIIDFIQFINNFINDFAKYDIETSKLNVIENIKNIENYFDNIKIR